MQYNGRWLQINAFLATTLKPILTAINALNLQGGPKPYFYRPTSY